MELSLCSEELMSLELMMCGVIEADLATELRVEKEMNKKCYS